MNCENCKSHLKEQQNYCPECGAKVIRNRLTVKNLSVDASQQFFNYDNKFLKTFLHLFTRPEHVIGGFINGVRKKYVNVIQYFIISLTLAGLQLYLIDTFYKDVFTKDLSLFVDMNGQFANSDSFKDMEKNMGNFTSNYQNIIYMISVPISALATWLSYYIVGSRRFNFTEHTVINLYFSGQLILVNSVIGIIALLLGINLYIVTTIITLLSFIYFFYIFKRVFNDSFGDALLKMILTFVIYSFFFFLIFVLSIIVGVIIKLNSA